MILVCSPVRPSVTFRCFIQVNEDTIVRNHSSFWRGKIYPDRLFAKFTPSEGVKVKRCKMWGKLVLYTNRKSYGLSVGTKIVRSASAVKPSEKSSVNTIRKSTTHFPMSPRWTSYGVPKPRKGGGAQKRKVSNIWIISCNNSETVWDSISVITNRKSHTGFRLIPTSMTLKDLK